MVSSILLVAITVILIVHLLSGASESYRIPTGAVSNKIKLVGIIHVHVIIGHVTCA